MDYEGFKVLARNKNLSKYEKIDFPDSYRKGKERLIFYDILSKLTNLLKRNQVVIDIGCGCSDLPELIADQCEQNNHGLIRVDSKEMLSLLPNRSFIAKVPGQFPGVNLPDIKANAILMYSVLQYADYPLSFIDHALELLAPGGQMLIGDIPNTSMRERLRVTHPEFPPSDGKIDDNSVIMTVMYLRNKGLNAFVVPQSAELPFSNRREDILVWK